MKTSEERVSLEDTGCATLVSVLAKEQTMKKCTFPNSDFIRSAAAAGGYRPLMTAFTSSIGLAQQSILRNTFPNLDFFFPPLLSDDNCQT